LGGRGVGHKLHTPHAHNIQTPQTHTACAHLEGVLGWGGARAGERTTSGPMMEWVLPDPVCPYAKSVTLYPSNTDCSIGFPMQSQGGQRRRGGARIQKQKAHGIP